MKTFKLLAVLVSILALSSCGDDPPSTSDNCVANWTDPNGQLECPDGAPASCDRASQCWPTVAECEASGQCN